MHRICGSLADAGFKITLVGRVLKASIPLEEKKFHQKRLRCFFNKGFLFYTEYNLRLFFFLLTKKMDGICAIDLDTILPCFFVSKFKNIVRIYDAHEYFTELKEVRTRPLIKRIWTAIEKFAVPKFDNGYTVSEGLAEEFRKNYQRNYGIIKNMPLLKNLSKTIQAEKYLLYQGAVNEARGFEFLIPAMKNINHKLIICGDGNFMGKLKELIVANKVSEKIELKGMLPPDDLLPITQNAVLGINLIEEKGLNQTYSLANKFFDYIQAGLPQISMNFPEYAKINSEHKVAVLIDKPDASVISTTINSMLNNDALLEELHQNCLRAREVYNWQKEEEKLLNFYKKLFNPFVN
jgi:glycosyltransferase involved in cell wall biosynthesis